MVISQDRNSKLPDGFDEFLLTIRYAQTAGVNDLSRPDIESHLEVKRILVTSSSRGNGFWFWLKRCRLEGSHPVLTKI